MSSSKKIQAVVLYATPRMREKEEVSLSRALASGLEAIRDRCAQTNRRVVGTPSSRVVTAAELGAHVFSADDVYLFVTAETVQE